MLRVCSFRTSHLPFETMRKYAFLRDACYVETGEVLNIAGILESGSTKVMHNALEAPLEDAPHTSYSTSLDSDGFSPKEAM